MFTRDDRSSDASRRGLWRSRWAALGAAVAVSLGAGGLFVAQAAPGTAESTIVSVTPERILDTRDPVNLGLAGPFVSPIAQKLQVTGSVPTATGTKVVVPTGATGVLLNVTAVGAAANGFVSIRPGDATGSPTTSSLNVTAGVTVPNAVQVSLPTAGANAGKIDITWDALGVAGPTTDIFIDVVGYTTNAGLQQLVADVAAKANTADVNAALATKANSTVFTRLAYSGPTTATAGPPWEKLRDVGTFTKTAADTGVKLSWQSHATTTGGTSCTWQIRIDDLNSSGGTEEFVGTEAVTNSADREALTVVDIFSGLAPGARTVSIWVRGAGSPSCTDNPGNFVRSVLVEEISIAGGPSPLTAGSGSRDSGAPTNDG